MSVNRTMPDRQPLTKSPDRYIYQSGLADSYRHHGLSASGLNVTCRFYLRIMSKKLEVLKNSLIKKERILNEKFDNHFATIKQANGQPLNDKRNGQATLNKWERQSESIRNQKESIEKTKRAIEIEEGKIMDVEQTNNFIPIEILDLVEKGELKQWRKHPNTFFVPNVDKARIVWDNKQKVVAHRYAHLITEQEQRTKFVRLYNGLNSVLNGSQRFAATRSW